MALYNFFLVPNTIAPQTFGPLQWVPLYKQSPTNVCFKKNSDNPQYCMTTVNCHSFFLKQTLVRSPWTDDSQNLAFMDKLSPINLVPLDKWSLEYSICPWGSNLLETICPGGLILSGSTRIICPGGQEI